MDAIKPLDARRGSVSGDLARRNQVRHDDLLAAGWDLIVVDEAHRIAGSNETVARYQLGKGLAAAAPYVIRTEKRCAVDAAGKPLFQPRQTRLLSVQRFGRHALQQQLYDEVSAYVRDGYNRAMQEHRNTAGFLLLLMQRLVASSTRAIRTTLERRLGVLTDLGGRDAAPVSALDAEEWIDEDSQAQLDEMIASAEPVLSDERAEAERLLSLARRCEAGGPDTKAEALLDLLIRLEREENDLELKALIFTEFVPTQAMLRDFLSARGYAVVCLNGSMDLDERGRAQQAFAGPARILISTDAGGEGLNLQCAHVAINYDMPWSPTKIEQRIGRVDRIGQTQPVRAFNFVLDDSVDQRVQEVLARKLAVILAEFGVDKVSDILDSAEAEADFEQLYRCALLNPEDVEHEIDRLMADIRARTAEARGVFALFDSAPPEPDVAGDTGHHPLRAWLEQLYVSAWRAEGGQALRGLTGYEVRRRPSDPWHRIHFYADPSGGGDSPDGELITLDDPRVQALLRQGYAHAEGQPIPVWHIAGLPEGVVGLWSLWQVRLLSGNATGEDAAGARARTFPLFIHESGRSMAPSARRIWEMLALPSADVREAGLIVRDEALALYRQTCTVAQREGEPVYRALRERQRAQLERESEKARYAFEARRAAIERIGLPNVRDRRLADLLAEEKQWSAVLRRQADTLPALQAVAFARIVAS